MPKRYGQACPVARSLEFLGERWTLLLVRDLLHGPRRFQDFQTSLAGIAPNVLSERLKVLEEHGIVARRLYSEHPPRAEYALTERGKELGVVVSALAIWGARHFEKQTSLVHEACAQPVELGYYCRHCNDRVRGNTVRLRRREPSVGNGPRRGGRARSRSASAASS
ncbi:MAG TPA: helix-turn-helix domain-containing protein [Methylomirabilota bacterium]|jgi:DNA-binding HxlR family transcriptional regulator